MSATIIVCSRESCDMLHNEKILFAITLDTVNTGTVKLIVETEPVFSYHRKQWQTTARRCLIDATSIISELSLNFLNANT